MSAATSTPLSRPEQIRREQIRVVYQNLPLVLGGTVVVVFGLLFALRSVVPTNQLWIWSIATLVLTAGRFALYWWNRRAEPRLSTDRWGSIYTLGSAASGILWGILGGLLLPPDSLTHQLFILFILVAMGAAAISSLTAHLPAFFAYFPVSMLPIGIALIQLEAPIQQVLGILTLTYVAVLSYFGRTTNKTITESLRLRFENVDLVRELSLQRDEAERANVAKSQFLAAASHDLRQPLHSLTLFTAALDMHIEKPAERKIVNNINASVGALEKLFNALLDVSRLDAGVLQPEPCDIALDDLFVRLTEDFSAEASEKSLLLSASSDSLIVYSDPVLLERVLRNYLSNAIRYTDEGTVTLRAVAADSTVRIEVRDSGIGIPSEHHGKIFDEFHQLGNPERDRTKGLGLGLAIVSRIGQLLDSDVEVTSRPGEGSCFSITVPTGNAAGIDNGVEQTRVATGPDLSGTRVLVLDDEIGVRDGMQTLLRQWGCEVVTAGSEDEAVQVAHTLSDVPEVIVADFRLREGRTGVQAIKRINKEFDRTFPALIVTGDTSVERVRQAKDSGYQVAYKPLQPAMLRAFLRNARRKDTSA